MFGLSSAEKAEAAVKAMLAIEQHTAGMQSGLQQFAAGNRLTAARYLPADGRALVWAGTGRLVGWSVHAVDGPVTVYLRDGRDENGAVLAVVDLVDGETNAQWFGPGGIAFPEALYADQTAGAGHLVGAWWIGAVD